MIARLLLQNLIWTVGLAALLFLPAGTLDWPAAWIYVLTTAALGLGGGLWLAKVDPGLLEERMKPMMQAGQPPSDKIFMLAFGLFALIWFVIIGLERRWVGPGMPFGLEALGFFSMLGACGFLLRVARENSFAAPIVKVQAERGHRVIDTGPYAVVRHPMYSGVILYFAAVALLLGSWWGLIFSSLFVALFAVRARLEERALREGLPGYADYQARVRYRLVPGFW
jgi:protein-S-isoprenylcysteine O-methyltransferase Ste14